MKKCPFCAELIQDEAIKCRYCFSDLNKESKTENTNESKYESNFTNIEDNTKKTTKSKRIVIYLAIIFICILSTIFIIVYSKPYDFDFISYARKWVKSFSQEKLVDVEMLLEDNLYIIRLIDGKIYYGDLIDGHSDPIIIQNAYEEIVTGGEIKLVKTKESILSVRKYMVSSFAPLANDSKVALAIQKADENNIIQEDDYALVSEDTKLVYTEEVNNVGYKYYLVNIDYSDNKSVDDNIKNQITSAIYEANFPQKQLLNIVIAIVNTLAIEPNNTYIISNSSKIKVGTLPPAFLKGGGAYSKSYGNISVIYISKDLNGSKLQEVLTHELGHHIGSLMTEEEWSEYYKLRYIPLDTPRRNENWQLSPQEDFAEVYKNIYTGDDIRTVYGLLVPTVADVGECYEIWLDIIRNIDTKSFFPFDVYEKNKNEVDSNTALQKCRRNVLLNPNKYSDEFFLGIPYKSKVIVEIKDFITRLLKRLNGELTDQTTTSNDNDPKPKIKEIIKMEDGTARIIWE